MKGDRAMNESGFAGQRTSPLAARTVSPVRIFLCDDHPLTRRGMIELIAEQPDMEICGQAAGVDEAFPKLKQTHPAVVIVDLSLRSGHGIELIEQIKKWNPRVKTLVVSAFDEKVYAERCLRAGALGYLNKDEAPEKLIEAIRAVLEGNIYLTDQSTSQMLQSMVGGRPSEEDPVARLSNRELEVFTMIGQGLASKDIAERLILSRKTVDSHRENIKIKLNLGSGHELTRYAMQWMLEQR